MGSDREDDAGVAILDSGLRDGVVSCGDKRSACHGDLIRYIDLGLLIVRRKDKGSGQDIGLVVRCKGGQVGGQGASLPQGDIKPLTVDASRHKV